MTEGHSMASLSLYIITFNCGRELIHAPAFASQLFDGVDSLPDLLILSLQEIAPLAQSYIGGSLLAPYLERIHDAVRIATKKLGGEGYTSIITRHVGMTAIIAFAKDPSSIEGVEAAGVGVGVRQTGNKGAVGIRLSYRDVNESGSFTELTFVAAHLAAMEDEVERRNEDWKNIVRGLVFSSTSEDHGGAYTRLSSSANDDQRPLLSVSPHDSAMYKPTSHLFVAGDLNYRTSTIKPGPEDHKNSFPQPHHEVEDRQHYSNLFQNDQLNQERAAGRTCHGLVEVPVTFPPTYKYNNDESVLVPDENPSSWNWATHRWPSWCDRILYLESPSWLLAQTPSAKIIPHRYIALPLQPTSDHRAVALAFTIPLVAIPEPSADNTDIRDPRIKPPFDIDPDWRSKRERARRYELTAGFSAYLTGTWEGRAVIFASGLGVVGSYFMLKAIFNF